MVIVTDPHRPSCTSFVLADVYTLSSTQTQKNLVPLLYNLHTGNSFARIQLSVSLYSMQNLKRRIMGRQVLDREIAHRLHVKKKKMHPSLYHKNQLIAKVQTLMRQILKWQSLLCAQVTIQCIPQVLFNRLVLKSSCVCSVKHSHLLSTSFIQTNSCISHLREKFLPARGTEKTHSTWCVTENAMRFSNTPLQQLLK